MQNVKKRLGFHNEIASRMCDASTKEKTNGTRLRRLLLDGGSQVLRKLFDGIHSSSALPSVLKTNEEDLRKKCKFPSQIELLFPIDGQPDSKKFDITLLTFLLRNICNLTASPTAWRKEPSPSDQSKEANIVRIRLFRNKIQHLPGSGISDEQFEELWNDLSSPLMALGLPEDEIEKLKVTPIDDSSEIQERFKTLCDHEHRIENLEEKINKQGAQIEEIKEELQNRKKQETVKSCIPDEPSNFIAREEELKEIIDAKTIDDIPYVLIHGMAGIGKSTLIKKASWHLVNEHNKTVYFVDLCRCKATEEEISKTINYKLYRGTKVENEPREALNIWARNLDRKVILVLDNAEHVLGSSEPRTGTDANSETGMSCLVKILLELREFSSQKLDYLIASREDFDAMDVRKKEITLKPFEQNESLKFINLVLSKETRGSSELTNDHKQEIVKLCSNIPLALRIVIPLLDDYKPDELIKKLKSKPMEDILEPLKRAVSLSFEKLDDTLRDESVKLTIFSGSFAADSAMAVIGVSEKNVAVQVLKRLSKKSLLQRENRKYSFHPFIHDFVVDYGNLERKNLLEEGKFNFLNYFQSLLLENTKLYWTKDSCEQSLSAFREDRENFEKALELSLRVPVDLNETRMENTKRILDELTNVILYLVACTSWDLLGRLLDNSITLAEKNNLPSRELESLCWKGHMARRKGDNEEYEKLLKKADEVYQQSGLQIDDRAKICYNSAKGRYFGHKRYYEQGVKAFEEIIEFCMEKEDNDSRLNEDYTRAIVELGHNLKGKEDFKMAVEKYKQANAIYEKHLGQHIKTAISFKDIADGYLTQGDAQLQDGDNEQQALDYYKKANDIYNKAIDMLTKLNSDSETHMILLLKNKGICCRKLKKYEDSETHFMKAITIAENNLKENHRYKCLVKEGLAHLHDEMGNKEKARTFAEEANEMAKNLKSGDCIKDRERLETILSYNSTS